MDQCEHWFGEVECGEYCALPVDLDVALFCGFWYCGEDDYQCCDHEWYVDGEDSALGCDVD